MSQPRGTALVVREAAALAQEDLFSDARVQLIKNTVARNVPDDVFLAMMDLARRRNLDPLAKQISAIQFGGQYQMIVTIDGYRSIAEQTGQYAGQDEPKFTYEDEIRTQAGKRAPTSATVTVYKMVDHQRCPFTATVYWEEYAGRNNWNTMPRTMLAKVAESHALRKAFPSVMSGTYTREEMDQAERPAPPPPRGPQDQTVVSGDPWPAKIQVVDAETGEIRDSTPGYMGTDDVPIEEPQDAQYRPVPQEKQPISERQMALLHALKKDARMSDTDLHQEAYETWGKTSLKDLTRHEASALIDSLKVNIAKDKQQAQRPTDDPAALANMARQPQLTPARQHALTRFRKALDLALIPQEHEEWWIQDKLNAPVQAEQVMASTLNAWAEEIEKNPRAANDWYEITKSQKDGLMPSEEELGR